MVVWFALKEKVSLPLQKYTAKIFPDGVKMCSAETAAVNTVGITNDLMTKM